VTAAVRDLSWWFASIKMANEMRKLRMADILRELDRAASRNCRTSKAVGNESALIENEDKYDNGIIESIRAGLAE
jgi:hypothetical protein